MQNKTTITRVLKRSASIVLSTVLVSQLFTGFVLGEAPDNFVDNSQLPAFPPIRSQGGFANCETFSGVYYQMTHMVALQKGWDTKNDPNDTKKFSPKFNSNIINKTGSLKGKDPYTSLKTFGAMTWSDFPYSGDSSDPRSYLECPTKLDKWKNAMNFRIDKSGYVSFSDGTDTPISGPDDPDLLPIKKLLKEGHVLTFGTYIGQWQYNPAYIVDSTRSKIMADLKIEPVSVGDIIKNDPNTMADNIDDPNTPENEIVVGKKYCYMQNGTDKESFHAMTVVGYSDDVWCDINMNNKVEIQEKGAFKIANSYGPEWGDEGFIYLSYDALNKISSVPDISTIKSFKSTARVGAISEDKFRWISVRENYSPKLTAELTVNHNCKEQLSIEIGCSNSNDSKPIMYLDNSITPGGKCSFDGTDNPNCDASIALDLTDIDCQKLSNPDLKWYLQLTDSMADGKKCVLKNFRIIDNRTGAVMTPSVSFPVEIDGSTVTIPIQVQRKADPFSSWNLMPSQTGGKLKAAYASYDGTLYAFGGLTIFPDHVGRTNEISSFKDGVWTTKALMDEALVDPKAHTINSKIYVSESTSQGFRLYEYTPSNNLWQLKTTNDICNFQDSAVVNGKLYIFDNVKGLFEYNCETNKLIKVADFPFQSSNFKVAAANNKIYIFGGNFSSLAKKYSPYVWEYDPQNNTWLQKKDMPNTKYNFQAISLNNKIYLFAQDKYYSNFENRGINDSIIEEYNPDTDTWTIKDNIIPFKDTFDLVKIDDKILFISNYGTPNPQNPKLYATYDPNVLLKKADINGDGFLNMADRMIIGVSFGSMIGDQKYNPSCDLNSDGQINIQDVVLFSKALGQ